MNLHQIASDVRARETVAEGVTLACGDCLAELPSMPGASADSCVTDPPYHLTTGKNGGTGPATLNVNSPAGRSRIGTGFMGKAWDGGDIAFRVDLWRAVFRALKPGAHLVAFGGTRTYHRMACAIEDAGFEIRDQLAWVYGSGFPKSLDVSKAIDKAAGAEREVVGIKTYGNGEARQRGCDDTHHEGYQPPWRQDDPQRSERLTAPATPAARQWDGFGTALKPAWEPIVLARKPLSESTVAGNVLRHGTGGLNIDGCRVGTESRPEMVRMGAAKGRSPTAGPQTGSTGNGELTERGRWPANLVHDGSEEVLAGFPGDAGGHDPRGQGNGSRPGGFANVGADRGDNRPNGFLYGDAGSAARFFYTAKADADDRLGSKHPTVKPIDLMRWLVRLVTPPGGLVLDPFAGTGTTGEAAFREGMRAVLIEREAEYQTDIRRRMALVLCGHDERQRASMKASGKSKEHGDLPLFGGVAS